MKRMNLLVFALMMTLCSGGLATGVSAQIQRISGADNALAGLTTFYPRVQVYDDGTAKEAGQAVSQLQSDLERMLSDAGYKLVAMDEFERLVASRSYPIALLDVEARMSTIPNSELKAYILSVKVRQAVYLARKPVVRFMASSWESTDFGAAQDFGFVRGVARDAVGRFVQDLQAQNPK